MATSVAAISYAAIGIYTGLAQQDLAGRSATIVCEYRVELIRDRLINFFQQAPDRRTPSAGANFSNLLRETRAVCAGSDPETLRKLGRIEALHHDDDERFQRHANARQELLAL